MNEREWLSSEDPSAMLEFLLSRHDGDRDPSGRKLKLFCAACCHFVSPELGRNAETITEWNSSSARNPAGWARAWCGDQSRPTLVERAALLREVIGNPFRPATTDAQCPYGPGDGVSDFLDWTCDECHGTGRVRAPWLTPQVLDLALAAYEHRARDCPSCVEARRYASAMPTGNTSVVMCLDCKGTGTIDDGTLDPFRLALLADAIEEAGCPSEVACQYECYPLYGCRWRNGQQKCDCDEGRVHHALLEHLRSPGPHVRGCCAVDSILGKE